LKSGLDGWSLYRAWEGRKMRTRFWCENLKEGELMEDQRADGWVILKFINKM